jgi:hypothetical protein
VAAPFDDAAALPSWAASAELVGHGWADGPDAVYDEPLDVEPPDDEPVEVEPDDEEPVDEVPVDDEPDEDEPVDEDVVGDADPADDELVPGVAALAYPTGGRYSNTA